MVKMRNGVSISWNISKWLEDLKYKEKKLKQVEILFEKRVLKNLLISLGSLKFQSSKLRNFVRFERLANLP